MEAQWEQEMINLASWRNHEEEEIQGMFWIDGEKEETATMAIINYTVVFHMDKGIVDYPDEIEWRRREIETEQRSDGE